MALVSIPNVFTVGAVIVASQHNANFAIIYSDYNGNISDINISASASISDSKLAQISTAGKVSGASLVSLGSVPSGSGTLPSKNGGTGSDLSAATIGADPYVSATGIISALAAGTSGQVKVSGGAGAPTWANALSSVLDYGTSASSSTNRQATSVKVAYGIVSVGSSSTQAISNLLFTSSSSYVVMLTYATNTAVNENPVITYTSGSSFTIKNDQANTRTIAWFAIGV